MLHATSTFTSTYSIVATALYNYTGPNSEITIIAAWNYYPYSSFSACIQTFAPDRVAGAHAMLAQK